MDDVRGLFLGMPDGTTPAKFTKLQCQNIQGAMQTGDIGVNVNPQPLQVIELTEGECRYVTLTNLQCYKFEEHCRHCTIAKKTAHIITQVVENK